MNCDRIRPLLSAYQDGALPPAERGQVRAHLATCAACREVLATYDRLYDALRADADVEPVPVDLYRAVYPAIRGEQRWRDGRRVAAAPLGALRAAIGTAGLLTVLAVLVLAALRLSAGSLNHGSTPNQPMVGALAHGTLGSHASATATRHRRATARVTVASIPTAVATVTVSTPVAPLKRPAVVKTPRAYSTSVGATSLRYDDTSSPSATLRSFYNAIDRHEIARAFAYARFLPADVYHYRAFQAGYDTTRTSELVRLSPTPYTTSVNGATMACVGVAIRATHIDGTVLSFGGWYLLRRDRDGWRILLSHARVEQNGRLTAPARQDCHP